MRKGTKILVKVLSAIILLLIILPLSLTLALTLNPVQNRVVQRATKIASDAIDAKVHIGSIHFSLLREFTLSEVLVEDPQGDTLLYAKTADIKISTLSLLSESLHVKSVALSDGQFNLLEAQRGLLNIKQILDKILSSEESDSNFKVEIDKISAENSKFALSLLVPTKEEFGVDVAHIYVDELNAEVSDFVVHNKITEMTIDKLQGVERSGLSIESCTSSKLVIYEGVLDLENLKLATLNSSFDIPKLRLESDLWGDYSDFNNRVSMEIESANSTIAASDVAYFAPALIGNTLTVSDVAVSVNGTVNNMSTYLEQLHFGESSSLRGEMLMLGVTDFKNCEFALEQGDLKTNSADINQLVKDFSSKELDSSVTDILERLGDLDILASAKGSVDQIALNAQLNSQAGEATYVGDINSALSLPVVVGEITTSNLEMGRLLANNSIGAMDMRAQVNYAQLSEGVDAKVDAFVSKVGYNSFNYENFDIAALFNGEILETRVVANDKKLNFDLASSVDLGTHHRYDLTLRVKQADLKALGLNLRDSLSEVSGSLRLNLEGNSIETLRGLVTLRNINYNYNDKSIYAPMLSINARNNRGNKLVALESDYVDINFKSKSSYQALYDYITNGMSEYIPLLYKNSSERNEDKSVTIADNYSTLSVKFKNFSEISDALSSGFDIADNSSFNFMVNPHSERFSLRLQSDYIEHNTLAATDLNINASNDKDSLSLYATASDLFVGRTTLPSCTLMAGARNNIVELSTGFRDSELMRSATLGMRVKFDSKRQADITLLPSQISLDDNMWLISANTIKGTNSHLYIDDFEMVNNDQMLKLDGVISKDPADSLALTLRNYDIGMVTSVINEWGYNVSGVSNGYVKIRQLLNSPRVVADVSLDSVAVNTIPSPPLNLRAGWDTAENRAALYVTYRNSRDTVMTGYYAPNNMRYYAKLKVDSLSAGLIDPILTSTIEKTQGYANVDLTLQGERNEASLQGEIDVYDLSTLVKYTQVKYSVPTAKITVDDNILTSSAARVYDKDGNSGLMTMRLSLDHLSNVSYMLRIAPESMLVLNTTHRDNELFYGTLYASGVATINGDKRGVNMDITATSQKNSKFFMPLSTQSSLTKTDFIKFVTKEVEEPNTATNYRKAYIDERNRRLSSSSSSRININMALHATPDLDFQLVIDPVVGDIIKAKGEGRLNLDIAPQDNRFEMYGDYNITEGNYLFTLLNPISKRFVIDNGSSIQWTGDPIDPILDINAVYKVKTSLDPLINGGSGDDYSNSSRAVPVDCIIHLGDRLAQPSVDFSIEVPTADTEQQAVIANTLIDQETISQQFFYLMFANSFIPVSSSYGSGLGGSTTASTGFELLSNQLSNWLSSSNYNVVFRYRPESELTNDEVDLGLSRGLIDNRLLIEVEGNYLADRTSLSESNASNWVGEAYITWLIDKAGTLRLKGFTQTIDRYDENQGLQETGIGIYYSESFDKFKDLKEKILNRFRRKKNKKNINN